ncbi:hypothetical protein [Agromyces bracchium]|uniref:Flagellar biosynthesis protein FlhA n=1 Tax=Agromyces bracchium TaxID=88376 RepID=A0A6I3MCP9_9MICO|nr:hypothetical protein [Agromyces bracchium]MTH69912.1 hypothetical protein [Agromyces bracchium]
MSRTVWTVLGVIAAVVIAWVLVDVVFSVLWFVVKLAIVAVVAVAVFFWLKWLVTSRDDRRAVER